MRYYAILALLLTTLPAGRVSATEGFNPKSTGLPIGGGTMAGDIDMNGHNLLNMGDWYHDVLMTDVLPDADLIKAQDSWSQSTTPANYVGAPFYVAGGLGSKSVLGVAAGSAGNTIVVTHNASQIGGASAVTTYTSDAGGWVCSTETDADCMCNLYDIVIAAPVSGWSIQKTDSGCSDTQLFFQPDAGTHRLNITETGTTFTATNRADGQVLIAHAGTAATPSLAWAADPDTGLYRSGADSIWFGAGGAGRMRVRVADVTLYEPLVVPAAGSISFSGLTELRAPADEQLQICNAAESQCFVLAATAADTATLFDGAGTGAGALVVNGTTQLGGVTTILDNFAFKWGSGADSQIQWATGQTPHTLLWGLGSDSNAVVILETADLGTNFLHPLQVDPTVWVQSADATHIGEYSALRYNGIAAGAPVTDVVPHDMVYSGANANAQASAGAARDGADIHVAAGIRAQSIVCDNWAWAALDEVVFTVNGVAQAALVEGTDWDDSGASNDAVCISLAAAIVTAAYGIVPDATTLAGTIYLTPAEDLLSLDSIVITDGGVDGDFGQVIDTGADGAVVLHGIHNALRVTSDGSGNTLLQFGGTTNAFPALKRVGTGLSVTGADDVGAKTLYAGDMLGQGDIRAGATSGIYHTGRTKWTSLGGDGIWEMGQNDGTQNARFDTATTDNVLILGTESDTTIGLQNIAGWWDLQADGDLVLDNPGATVNSPTFSLKGDDGGVEEEASFQLLQGADPYLQISVTDDSATPALLPVIDIHDTLIAPSSGGATVNLGNSTNYFTQFYGIYATLQDQTNPSHGLSLKWDEDGAADYHLGFKVNGASRTIDLTGNLTVEAASIINQDLSTDSTTAALGSISLDSITSTESDIAERITDSAKVTTTDALDNLIASVTLADGEVLTVEVTILGRERDGSDRNVYHIQGLFYRQGAGAVQQGVSTYIAEVESDVDWCGDLAVSGNDVQITVDGNGDTVDWEITYTYQILVSAA